MPEHAKKIAQAMLTDTFDITMENARARGALGAVKQCRRDNEKVSLDQVQATCVRSKSRSS